MKSILGFAAIICLISGPAAKRASADIVYELKNVRLEYMSKSAGTLTGSFTTNDARTQLLDVNLIASAAKVSLSSWLPSVAFAAATYTLNNSTDHSDLNGSLYGVPLPGNLALAQAPGATPTLSLVFALGLAATGRSSILPIVSSASQNLLLTRVVSSGSVVARQVASPPPVTPVVPEPSALAVAAICAPALLAYARRRRRQGTDAA